MFTVLVVSSLVCCFSVHIWFVVGFVLYCEISGVYFGFWLFWICWFGCFDRLSLVVGLDGTFCLGVMLLLVLLFYDLFFYIVLLFCFRCIVFVLIVLCV